jgi:hypothetical protein
MIVVVQNGVATATHKDAQIKSVKDASYASPTFYLCADETLDYLGFESGTPYTEAEVQAVGSVVTRTTIIERILDTTIRSNFVVSTTVTQEIFDNVDDDDFIFGAVIVTSGTERRKVTVSILNAQSGFDLQIVNPQGNNISYSLDVDSATGNLSITNNEASNINVSFVRIDL